MTYVKFERVGLRQHPELNERWVQDRIADDPTMLGLGDIVLKDKERVQPRAGRLDLLFQEADGNRRFEVEVQLGATDESHIIRTIEYWDVERKRYPQYEHSAVLIAEDITSRFLNVISLFNGHIPLVAIQMAALRLDDKIGLVFTKVLDQVTLGPVDEDEEVHEVTDRAYWEARASASTMSMVDQMLAFVKSSDPHFELKFNKFYIGLAQRGEPVNVLILRPKQSFLRVEPWIPESDEVQRKLEEAGLDVMDYDKRWGRYRLRVVPGDLAKNRPVLEWMVKTAFDAWHGAG